MCLGLNISYAVSITAAFAIATCLSLKFGSSHLVTASYIIKMSFSAVYITADCHCYMLEQKFGYTRFATPFLSECMKSRCHSEMFFSAVFIKSAIVVLLVLAKTTVQIHSFRCRKLLLLLSYFIQCCFYSYMF